MNKAAKCKILCVKAQEFTTTHEIGQTKFAFDVIVNLDEPTI